MRTFVKKFWGYLFLFLLTPNLASAGVAETYDAFYSPVPQNQLFCPTPVCNLIEMFLLVIRNILQLIPIASVLMIIIGGFQMISSVGNEEKLVKAKRTLFWAVMGLIISILSFSIVAIVKNFFGAKI